MIVLRLSMPGKDVSEHTNGKCRVFTFLYARGKTVLSILMASVICIYSDQLVDHLCNIGMHLVTILDLLMSRYQ